MSRFDLNNNHPIIPNSNQYYFEKKYISIHSEDRDVIKYRNRCHSLSICIRNRTPLKSIKRSSVLYKDSLIQINHSIEYTILIE